jgi:DNA polymerase kappa
MPGFYEHENEAIGMDDDDDDDADLVDPQPPPDPPRHHPSTSKPVSESRVSDIVKTSTSLNGNTHLHGKPRSMSAAIRPKSSTSSSGPARNTVSKSLTCPVCQKEFQTDNEGLNAHIDFCLSRGAIRQAHAEASSPVKKSSKTRQRQCQNTGKESTTKRMGNS